jgi:type II secretory ATPase GspE/PulE/Tfp pilus assembly ATPase PilB-like protein
MILVTGPTGSGKTTTLYAMIGKIFSEGTNIVTLEDPIEYQIKGINQSQVNSEIGYTFANGLRSILRQDPDVIMLGEIRDKETAEMAVHAALTGHVVLSTLHTNDASGAIPRLIDMGVEPFLLTSSINVVMGQRLARTICPDCKEEAKLPETEVELIKKEIEKMPAKEKEELSKKTLKFYKGKGCKTCDESGYRGRIGIYEVLGISESVKELILKRVPASQIEQKGILEGMLTMMQDGIIKALDGKTSMEEIWRVTKE